MRMRFLRRSLRAPSDPRSLDYNSVDNSARWRIRSDSFVSLHSSNGDYQFDGSWRINMITRDLLDRMTSCEDLVVPVRLDCVYTERLSRRMWKRWHSRSHGGSLFSDYTSEYLNCVGFHRVWHPQRRLQISQVPQNLSNDKRSGFNCEFFSLERWKSMIHSLVWIYSRQENTIHNKQNKLNVYHGTLIILDNESIWYSIIVPPFISFLSSHNYILDQVQIAISITEWPNDSQ